MRQSCVLGGSGVDVRAPVAEALEGRRLLAAAPAAPQSGLVPDVTLPGQLEAQLRYEGQVATLSGVDANRFERLNRGRRPYPKAFIDWGDGRRDVQPLIWADSDTVQAATEYMYHGPGTYTVEVTFRLRGRVLGRVSESVQVAESVRPMGRDRPVGLTLEAVARRQFTGALGTFISPWFEPYSPVIEWGDGSKSDATLELLPDGTYRASGSHTYRRAGTYIVTLSAGFGPSDPQIGAPAIYVDPVLLSKIVVSRG